MSIFIFRLSGRSIKRLSTVFAIKQREIVNFYLNCVHKISILFAGSGTTHFSDVKIQLIKTGAEIKQQRGFFLQTQQQVGSN